MDQRLPSTNQYVQSVLNDWPQTKSVFIGLGTACVGCELARFCSLADVAATYQLSPEFLLKKIQEETVDNLSFQAGGSYDIQSI